MFLNKQSVGDFPGAPVVKNSPSNAEDMGLIPGRGTKIPHSRLWQLLNPGLHQKLLPAAAK